MGAFNMNDKINQAKAKALAAKEGARLKIADARMQAAEAKRMATAPKFVTMPEQTGNAEQDAKADLTELQAGFRSRASAEASRFALATDSEFWGVICFQTREQRDVFFTSLGLLEFGDSRYYDGVEVAQKLGIQLPEANLTFRPEPKVDPVWSSFVKK
jgi:hypothetical protein